MSQVITFSDYTPSPRFDGNPWTDVRIEEGSTDEGPWVEIETIPITPVDSDPRFPAARSFTTEDASDTLALWYRLVFIDGTGDEEQPTEPVQNVPGRVTYATVEELARVLKVNSSQRWSDLRRVLESAALEIDAELDREEPFDSPPALVREVNVERAVEHWQQMQSPFGLIGLGSELGPSPAGRDTWERHALKLAPLKQRWGIA